jgi:site-specific recombinase XerD
MSETLGMPFEKVTKDDIVRLIVKLESGNIADWTKRDYRVILKHFFKWMKNWEDGFPPEVRWLKKTTGAENKRPILAKDLLTPEEKTTLVNATQNSRDRALLEVFFESGRRMGEILTLHIGDIEFDEIGAKLSIHGKVGNDFARIISSAPTLRMWIESHPMKQNPDAALWVGLGGKNKNKQISYSSARYILRKLAKMAGIKKRIHYYLFRHTRIDESLGKLTEAQQCMMFGWKFGSRMPATYMKRYGKHIDDAQVIMNGIETTPKKIVPIQKPKICIRCKTENSAFSKFCTRCSTSLDIEFGVEAEAREAKIRNLLSALLNDPQELEKLREYLAANHHRKA